MDRLSDEELGKRLSAARGYTNRETTAAFARRIDVNRQDLEKWERGDFGSTLRPSGTARKRADAIAKLRHESGLPTEFFSVDFNKLPEMVEAWKRAGGVGPTECPADPPIDPETGEPGGEQSIELEETD